MDKNSNNLNSDYILKDYEQSNLQIRHHHHIIYWLTTLELGIYVTMFKFIPESEICAGVMSLFKNYNTEKVFLFFFVGSSGLILNHGIFGLNYGITRYSKQLNSIREYTLKNSKNFNNFLWTDVERPKTWSYKTFRILLLVYLIILNSFVFSVGIIILLNRVVILNYFSFYLLLVLLVTIILVYIQISFYRIRAKELDKIFIP